MLSGVYFRRKHRYFLQPIVYRTRSRISVLIFLIFASLVVMLNLYVHFVSDLSSGESIFPIQRDYGNVVDWASFRGRKDRKIAYFFTPYQLVPGGGERYLLTFARMCRNLGYNVSLLVLPENCVRSIEGLHALGRKMAIDLEKMHIITVTNLNGKLDGVERNPEIFFTLGNEKYPKVEGIGQYNIFMCQLRRANTK